MTKVTLFLLTILYWAAPDRLAAQYYRPIGEDGLHCDRLPLTLPPPPPDIATGHVFRFSGVRVIDSRPDTTRIAYVYDNSNVLAKMDLSGSLSTGLEHYLNEYYKNVFSPVGDSLLLLIRDFRLSCMVKDQWTTGARRFFVQTDVILGLKKGDSVSLLGRFDTLALFGLKHEVMASECLSRSLYAMLRQADSASASGSFLETERFIQTHTDTTTYPILTETNLKRGAYANFQEVLDNKPSYTYTAKYPGIHSYIIVARDSTGATVTYKKIWGFCDGFTIFAHEAIPPVNNEDYFPVVRFKNSLVILPRDADYGYKPSAAGIVFGVLLIFATKGAAPVTVYRTPPVYLLSYGGKQYPVWGTEINLRTGQLEF